MTTTTKTIWTSVPRIVVGEHIVQCCNFIWSLSWLSPYHRSMVSSHETTPQLLHPTLGPLVQSYYALIVHQTWIAQYNTLMRLQSRPPLLH